MIVHATPPVHIRPATSAATGEPARRLPLYLYGRVATQVGADGPALLVRRAGKAPARYPLNRLSRIISGARVEWSARALSACLDNDLPIVFLDHAGQPAGYLHAAQTKPSRLDDLLMELLDRPDGLGRYTLWLRHERKRVLHAWRSGRAAAGADIGEDEYRELVRRHVYRDEDGPLGLAGEHLYRGALSAYAIDQIQRAGARPIYWGQHGQPLRLADDLAELLALDLSLQLRGLGRAAQGDDAALLTLLHAFGESLAECCRRTLGRLHRHIKETLDEWR